MRPADQNKADPDPTSLELQGAQDRAWKLHEELKTILPKTYVRSRSNFFKRVASRKAVSVYFSRDGKDHRRDYVLGSGASKHLVSRNMLTAEEKRTIRKSLHPIEMNTASGPVRATEEVQIYVKDLDIYVWAMILDNVPPLLSIWANL